MTLRLRWPTRGGAADPVGPAGLTALTVFDAILVWLTWREYRSRRAAHPVRAPVAVPSATGHSSGPG